jgi:hypothetical protein
MGSKKNIFRTKLLIYPRFQVPLLVINGGVVVAVSLLVWVGLRNALADLKPLAGLSGMQAEYFRKYLDYQAVQLQTTIGITLFLGLIGSTLLTLVVSHRLAGPMVRLKNYFRTLNEGQQPWGPLEFRDGDYLRDLPPIVNEFIDKTKALNQAEGKVVSIDRNRFNAPKKSA